MKKKIIILASCCALLFSSCGSMIEKNETSSPDTSSVVTTFTTTAQTSQTPSETTTVTETAVSTEQSTVTSAPETTASEGKDPEMILPDDSTAQEEAQNPKTEKEEKIKSPHSSAYALYCLNDRELITGKAMNKKISLASTTKLLTASVMLEYLDPGSYVTVGEEVYYAKPDSTMSYIQPGTDISVNDLLAAMLLPSGNDAAYTAAVNTAWAASGDYSMSYDDAIAYFVGLMNDFADGLGMKGSHFANPEGWDDPEHYTTMADMLKLAEYVLGVPVLREITSSFQWEFNSPVSGYLLWTNTNLFINPYSYYYRNNCIGIKTGTTSDAGCCLISAFEINGKTYICAVMGCNENEDRYTLAGTIIDKYAV